MSNENGHTTLPGPPAKRTLKYSLRGSFDCECSRSADTVMMHVFCEQRSSPVSAPGFFPLGTARMTPRPAWGDPARVRGPGQTAAAGTMARRRLRADGRSGRWGALRELLDP